MTLFKGSGGIPSRSAAGAATALTHALAAVADLAEGHRLGHGRRIAWLALRLAPLCDLDAVQLPALYYAALLHDVGELWLPSEVFHRSGPTQRSESIGLWEHPVIGADLAARLGALPPAVADIVRWHHEWWDGTGYPDQLQWSQIPPAAQLLRLADTFVSAAAERPNRHALPVEEVYQQVMAGAGREFGPRYARAFSLLFQTDPTVAQLGSGKDDPSAELPASYPLTGATGENVEALLLTIADAADARHAVLGGHSRRTGQLAAQLAERLGWDAEEIDRARVLGYLHDIGMAGVPGSIIGKADRLTSLERTVMQRHVSHGFEILRHIPELEGYALPVRHHHERIDGSGYPDALTDQAITAPARLMAICDTYDALTTGRPYRTTLGPEDALARIERDAGFAFDPSMVHALASSLPAVTR
ncbi:MAG TPA: HD domain-containing phosphohydrolase [Candidatus Dormibacteraeota bacterium]|nr:HD domain-containing phosphohydrolase [Candidatus Dormibacteraeota bacterium]